MSEIELSAIYSRTSSNNQKEASIHDQIRTCRDAASSKNWVVLDDHIYYDKARTGTESNLRPAFREMMRIAMSPNCPFKRILVDDTSRIARNTREALNVFTILSFYGVHVYYVAQNIDSSHETAEEMITINGLIDSLFIRNLAKETHRGIKGQVLKGYSAGGKRYGYRSEPVYSGNVDIYSNPEADGYILKINADEADTIIRIYSMFGEQGLSAKKIVKLLNQEIKKTGSPKPPRGTYWSVTTVLGSKKHSRGILNNKIYIGKYYWNRSKTKRNPENGKMKYFAKPEQNWVIRDHSELRIISDALWSKVKSRQKQILVTTEGRFVKGKSIYSTNLLTGLLTCKECGGNIVIVSGGKFAKYGCSNNWNKGDSVCSNEVKITKKVLDKIVIDKLQLNTSDNLFIDTLSKKVNELVEENLSRKTATWRGLSLEEELKKVRKEVNNLIQALTAGIITDGVKDRLLEKEKRVREMQKQLIETNSLQITLPVIDSSLIIQYVSDIYKLCTHHPVLGKKLLSLFIDHIDIIVLTGDEFEINMTTRQRRSNRDSIQLNPKTAANFSDAMISYQKNALQPVV